MIKVVCIETCKNVMTFYKNEIYYAHIINKWDKNFQETIEDEEHYLIFEIKDGKEIRCDVLERKNITSLAEYIDKIIVSI